MDSYRCNDSDSVFADHAKAKYRSLGYWPVIWNSVRNHVISSVAAAPGSGWPERSCKVSATLSAIQRIADEAVVLVP